MPVVNTFGERASLFFAVLCPAQALENGTMMLHKDHSIENEILGTQWASYGKKQIRPTTLESDMGMCSGDDHTSMQYRNCEGVFGL
jgi:hypothetical protein